MDKLFDPFYDTKFLASIYGGRLGRVGFQAVGQVEGLVHNRYFELRCIFLFKLRIDNYKIFLVNNKKYFLLPPISLVLGPFIIDKMAVIIYKKVT